MASVGEWVAGARPRTLPTAVSPVLVGTGAAVGAGAVQPVRALLALVVAVALVVGVNYANDYSDGIRGTDDERVGPMRLVGSRLAAPAAVRNAAFLCFSVAALAGLTLVSLTRQWWLVAVGAVCIAGAWFYTGGRRPYGYAGLGEVAVFVFFGPVAVLGTAADAERHGERARDRRCRRAWACWPAPCWWSTTCATSRATRPSGKRTLAVALGDRDTRRLYAACVAAAAAASPRWPGSAAGRCCSGCSRCRSPSP